MIRRLAERIGGWRLTAFVVIALINLATLATLGRSEVFLSEWEFEGYFSLLRAHTAITAVWVGGLGTSYLRKLAVIGGDSLLVIWVLKNIAVEGVLDIGYPPASLHIMALSVILMSAATLAGGWRANRPSTFSDWIVSTVCFAALIVYAQQLLPSNFPQSVPQFDWAQLAREITNDSAAVVFCLALALSNGGALRLNRIVVPKSVIWIILAVSFLLIGFDKFEWATGDADTLLRILTLRGIFVGWSCFSLLPYWGMGREQPGND